MKYALVTDDVQQLDIEDAIGVRHQIEALTDAMKEMGDPIILRSDDF